MDDEALRTTLRRLPPDARDDLRRLLVADVTSRDAIAQQLLRRQTPAADQLADVIDMLSLNGDARRRVVRILGELEAQL